VWEALPEVASERSGEKRSRRGGSTKEENSGANQEGLS